MTPPINIDGTDITGGTIDGTDFSVVTVDGTTVFSAIPDGAVARWKLEGSNPAIDSIGSNNLTLNGASYISDTNAQGGQILQTDGVDDEPTANHITEITGDNAFSFAFTIDVDNSYLGSSGTQQVFLNSSAGQNENTLSCSVGNDSNGELEFESRDSGSNVVFRSGIDVSNESGLIRPMITHDGTGNTTVYINATQVTDTNRNGNIQDSDGFFVGWSGSNAFEQYWNGRIDDIIPYSKELTPTQVQSDYDSQPFA